MEQSEALLVSKYGINFLLGRNQCSKELDSHNKTGDGRFRFGKSVTAGINILTSSSNKRGHERQIKNILKKLMRIEIIFFLLTEAIFPYLKTGT